MSLSNMTQTIRATVVRIAFFDSLGPVQPTQSSCSCTCTKVRTVHTGLRPAYRNQPALLGYRFTPSTGGIPRVLLLRLAGLASWQPGAIILLHVLIRTDIWPVARPLCSK